MKSAYSYIIVIATLILLITPSDVNEFESQPSKYLSLLQECRPKQLALPEEVVKDDPILKVIATAYTHTGNPTKSGVMPSRGQIAVDPRVIPLGTEVYIEGYGSAIATDTGGLIKGHKIDLFMETEEECIEFGRKKLEIKIIE